MVPEANPGNLTSQERELVNFYRNAQPQRRKALFDMAKALVKASLLLAIAAPGLSPERAEAAFDINRIIDASLAKPASVIHIVQQWLNRMWELAGFNNHWD